MPNLCDALLVAAEAHYGQTDPSGDPYIWHVLRVICSVSTEEEKIVAALHDVCEDGVFLASRMELINPSGLSISMEEDRCLRCGKDG